PRMGKKRELKFALEKYWRKKIDQTELQTVASGLRQHNWQTQHEAGVDLLPAGDFALYDHVLNTTLLLGVVPPRFVDSDSTELDLEFRIARGRAPTGKDVAASDMTKWFNTNYHYIVPELAENQSFELSHESFFEQIEQALALGHQVKPVLLGPLTYLWLANGQGNKLALLPGLLAVYQQILLRLESLGINWLQIDEPLLALEIDDDWRQAFVSTYQQLNGTLVNLLLTTYFGDISHNLDIIKQCKVQGLHVDIVAEAVNLEHIHQSISADWVLSLGCVNGRNVWRSDLQQCYQTLAPIYAQRAEKLWLAPSCSLLHSPVDLNGEEKIDPAIRSWLAFSKQKCQELKLLKTALLSGETAAIIEYSVPVKQRLASDLVQNSAVHARVAGIVDNADKRCEVFEQRKVLQQQQLDLPILPTTTIGSFPQTNEIRRLRQQWRRKNIDTPTYEAAIKVQIKDTINAQVELGLDVLVHGEPERTDMVEYFGELLEGVVISGNGWVQSYGSRCVKPPIIFGDISRSEDMTVRWSEYAQSLTTKPVKGMLTGPVTILCWSFVRDDATREQVTLQLALALQDEVSALTKAGIDIIQIDEPAIREGLPIKRSNWQQYLDWASYSFRLSAASAPATTQIHTHMCYSEFNEILPTISALDADVLTIETSRSNMALLDAFEQFNYPNDIGPGVYDIHSPNIPTVDWIKDLLNKAKDHVPINRLWVNPDCGLKTRQWDESKLALANMVEATKALREELV
ncbi:MAG: 5-methyltetrahydropteroyltriglutamate--homocysteine methyltransferase, partial [Phenylobacterium sp.]